MKQTILLVYIGREQGSWGTIAFSRSQHYYVMPGIRYCAAALRRDAEIGEAYTIECLYLNESVQSVDEMLEAIEARRPALVGFSVFCWNRSLSMDLAARLRARSADAIIMAGGPELHVDSPAAAAELMGQHPYLDCVVLGEAETRLPALVRVLTNKQHSAPSELDGYLLSNRFGGVLQTGVPPLPGVEDIPSPYPAAFDVPRSPDCGISVVYETSRGCPYDCIYCQFGHRDRCLRFLPLDRLETELAWILEQQVESLHVADAVFDIKPERAKHLLRFLHAHNRRTSLFFYCGFFSLDDELAELFERTQCQIDVGVQSTNRAVLKRIHRALSPRLFAEARDVLRRHRINFYVDLIFGLPDDSQESFRRSFDDVISLDPAFVMLFPLTLIKGTRLARQREEYGVEPYGRRDIDTLNLACDIEYTNIGLYHAFTAADLEAFDGMAVACFYFYTRFRRTLRYLARRRPDGPAALYAEIGGRTKQFLQQAGKRATNVDWLEGFQEHIERIFRAAIDVCEPDENEREAFRELYKLDLFCLLIRTAPAREQQFQRARQLAPGPSLDTSLPTDTARALRASYGKELTLAYKPCDLSQLHELRGTIMPCSQQVYVHAPYEHWCESVVPLSDTQRALIDAIPLDRPRRVKSVVAATLRVLKHEGASDPTVRAALTDLVRQRVVALGDGPARG
ncbi:MAG: radical SAM protein [Chitinivibrionales bacterium]|nr:radical SAM protein [Chitinivibrionales bacterium]